MALTVNSNFSAASSIALNSMKTNKSAMAKSIAHVSTGSRVTSISDDVSAYIASKRLKGDSDGYKALYNNVQNGATYLNAADRAMSSVLDILSSMKAKASEYKQYVDNNTRDDPAATSLAAEFEALKAAAKSAATVKVGSHEALLTDNQSFSFDTSISGAKFLYGGSGTGITDLAGKVLSNATEYTVNTTDGTVKAYGTDVGSYNTDTGEVTLNKFITVSEYQFTSTASGTGYFTGLSNGVRYEGTISGKTGSNPQIVDGSVANGTNGAKNKSTAAVADGKIWEVYTLQDSGFSVGWDSINKYLQDDYLDITKVDKINEAIDGITSEQAKIGGGLSAMEYISTYLSEMASVQDEAYSTITEADMAAEMTTYVKSNIYSQAAQAMIAQANQSMAQVLNLLQ